jgi:hypothetical protein
MSIPILTEAWTADQIRNNPDGVIGSAVRAASGAGRDGHRPAIALSTLPVLGNNRRRWQTSVYQAQNVLQSRDGLREYALVVRADLHQVICQRSRDYESGWSAWAEVIDLRTIGGDPFGAQVDDSHNTFSMGEDEDGNVHVWGNMHGSPMHYARTTTPGSLATLTAFTPWASNTNLVTYPVPYIDGTGTLCVGWRNGYATSGDYFISRFVGGAWSAPLRILNGSASGQGAYPHNMAVSRDGKLGLFFIWRGDGDASTNERPGYIESLDNGATWRDVDGTVLTLPVTRATAPVILDVAVGSGLINQGGADFDIDEHPHAGWQMYGDDGNTQLFHFWHDGDEWRIDQVTDWTHRIETVGQTTLDLQVARIQTICTVAGRTYFITRTDHEGFGGAPIMIDVTPGADRSPFKLMAMNLFGWEPAYDVQRFRRTGELTMLVTPIAPNADSRTNWDAQWLGVLSIDTSQLAAIQAGLARMPTIRTLRTYEQALEVPTGVGGTADAAITRAVLPTAFIPAGDTGKDAVLFSKVTAWVLFKPGSSSGTLYLRAQPSAGALPSTDLSHIRMVNSSITGLFALPWEPLPRSPYVESNGIMRDTQLVPRAIANNAAGLEVRSYVIEIGILDWI